MNKDQLKAERIHFVKWADNQGYRYGVGEDEDSEETTAAWRAWQARAELSNDYINKILDKM